MAASGRGSAADSPGIQLSASVAALLSVRSPQPPIQTVGWGSRDGPQLETSLERIVAFLEGHVLFGPELLHDGELLFEPRAPLLKVDAVELKLVGL